jgi:hypothetical protein
VAGTRKQRWTAAGLGAFLTAMTVVAVVFGVSQVRHIATSRAIQRGPTTTATTVRVSSAGAHGGASLIVDFTTETGTRVRTEVHDGDSDGVHHRATLPVRYEPSDPQLAEVAGQPLNTSGQAVLDFGVAAVLGLAAVVFVLAAAGLRPLASLQRRSRSRRPPR